MITSMLISGGALWPLTAASEPPSGHLVWASNREDGRHEIYRSNADGTDITRLTYNGGKMATWSPDGRWIAYRTLDESTHVIRWDGSDDHEIFKGIPSVPDAAAAPHFWMYDNSGLVVRAEHTFSLVNPESGEASRLFDLSELTAVANNMFALTSISRDGRWLIGFSDIYHNGHPDPEITYTGNNAVVALDLQDPRVAWFIGPGCEPTFSPAEEVIFHVYDRPNSYANPLATMAAADLENRASYMTFLSFENAEWGHQYFPRVSSDGRWLVYGASDGCQNHQTCNYDIFLHDLHGPPDNRTRIIEHPENDQWPHLRVGEPFPLDRKLHLSRSLVKITEVDGQFHSSPATVDLVAWANTPPPQDLTIQMVPGTSDGWLQIAPVVEQGRVSLTWSIDPTGLEPGRYRQVVMIQPDGIAHSALSLEFEFDLKSSTARPPSDGSCSLFGSVPSPLMGTLAAFLLLAALRRRSAPPPS